MKDYNFLLMRLGVLSLASVMAFSVAQAATARKKPKQAAAVIETLIHQAVAKAAAPAVAKPPVPAGGTVSHIFSTPVVVGAGAAGVANPDGMARNLTVLGDARIAGDVEAGALGALQLKDGKPVFDNQGNFIYKTPGRKHIIGIASLNPRTQQFRIVFKDKTAASHGAFVNLDFVTTATGKFGATITDLTASGKKAVVGVKIHDLFCHPQLKANQIMAGPTAGLFDTAIEADGNKVMTAGGIKTFIMNGYLDDVGGDPIPRGDQGDLSLTAMVRLEESTTNNVNIGFVPAAYSYSLPDANAVTIAGNTHGDDAAAAIGNGFYDAGFEARLDYPIYDAGTLSYQIASDNVVSADVVTQVANGELLPADVFQLFTDDELVSLLAILKDYFGEDVVKMREYLIAHRHQLSRAFHESH